MNEPAVRAVERWGLLAGVTGIVGNILLIALYALALPGLESFEWTGPANDVIGGIVSTGALIPVAFALRDLLGGGSLVHRMTSVAVLAMVTIVVLALLLVVNVTPFAAQGPGAGAAAVVMFVWVGVVGRAGAAGSTLPRGLARGAVTMGVAASLGALLVGVSLLLPQESIPQYLMGGAGLILVLPAWLAFPVWLIRLSNVLRVHLVTGLGQGFADQAT